MRALVGAELFLPADAGLAGRGNAVLAKEVSAQFQCVNDLVFGCFAHGVEERVHRGFAQDACWLAMLVAIDRAVVRVGRIARDTGKLQRLRVRRHDVVAHAAENDRVIRRDSVEIMTRRDAALGEHRLVVAATQHPRSRRLRSGALLYQRRDLFNGRDGVRREVDLGSREADPHDVGVRVVEPGNRRPSLQVDLIDVRADPRPDVGQAPRGDDPFVDDADRLDLGLLSVHGQYRATVDKQGIPHAITPRSSVGTGSTWLRRGRAARPRHRPTR